MGTTGSSGSSYMYGATSGYRNDWDGGLYHVGARYYDSQVGRFVTPDSFLDQNPFLYCDHDPVNHLDPTGHDAADAIIEVGGVMAGFGGAAYLWKIENPPAGAVVTAIGAVLAGIGYSYKFGQRIGNAAYPMPNDGDVLYPALTNADVIRARKELYLDYKAEYKMYMQGTWVVNGPTEWPKLPPKFHKNW